MPAKGQAHTPEARERIAASLRGRALSPAHREALSRARRGVPKSQAHREAIARGVRRALRARCSESWEATQPPPKKHHAVAPEVLADGASNGAVESNHATDRLPRSYDDRDAPATS